MRIWVTRTMPGAERTAERLAAMGHEAIVEPVLEVRPLPGATVDMTGAAALAFTSPNAVEAFAPLSARRDLPVFVTGRGTGQAARDLGFSGVTSADGGGAELADLLRQRRFAGRIVWLGPTEPAFDLSATLANAGVEIVFTPIYQTVPSQRPAPSGIDAVLIHSPKAARLVAERLSAERAGSLAVYAISGAAAEPLSSLPFARVSVAPLADETALLGLLAA